MKSKIPVTFESNINPKLTSSILKLKKAQIELLNKGKLHKVASTTTKMRLEKNMTHQI